MYKTTGFSFSKVREDALIVQTRELFRFLFGFLMANTFFLNITLLWDAQLEKYIFGCIVRFCACLTSLYFHQIFHSHEIFDPENFGLYVSVHLLCDLVRLGLFNFRPCNHIMWHVFVRYKCDHCGRCHAYQIRSQSFIEPSPIFVSTRKMKTKDVISATMYNDWPQTEVYRTDFARMRDFLSFLHDFFLTCSPAHTVLPRTCFNNLKRRMSPWHFEFTWTPWTCETAAARLQYVKVHSSYTGMYYFQTPRGLRL